MHLYNVLLALQRWQIDPVVHERLFTLVLGLIWLLVATLVLSSKKVPAGQYYILTSNIPFHRKSPKRFVLTGEQGVQARVLKQGWHFDVFLINTPLWKLDGPFPFVEIPADKFGVLIANEGASLPLGRPASGLEFSYDDYMDGEAFLEKGGERGPQMMVLGPGFHGFHQGLFSLHLIEKTVVKPGYVAVLICKVGDDPEPDQTLPVGSKKKGGRPVSILKPRDQRGNKPLRGIEAEVLGPGAHVINPFTHDFEIVDTTPTRLQVDGTNSTVIASVPTQLEAISVITSDGFSFKLKAEAITQVLPDHAPAVISLGGTHVGFVHEIIVPYLDHIMRAEVAEIELKYFIQHLDEVRETIEMMLRAALEGPENAVAALSDSQKSNKKLIAAIEKGAQVDQREQYPLAVNGFRFLSQGLDEAGPRVQELLQQLAAVSIAREEAIARVEQLKVAQQDTEIAKQHALAQAAEIVQEAKLRAEASNFDVEVIKKRLEVLAPILEQTASLGQVSQGILAALIGSQLNPDLMAMAHAITDELIRRPDQLPAAINPDKSPKPTTT